MGFQSKRPMLIDPTRDKWSRGHVTVTTTKEDHAFYETVVKALVSCIGRLRRKEIKIDEMQNYVVSSIRGNTAFLENIYKELEEENEQK